MTYASRSAAMYRATLGSWRADDKDRPVATLAISEPAIAVLGSPPRLGDVSCSQLSLIARGAMSEPPTEDEAEIGRVLSFTRLGDHSLSFEIALCADELRALRSVGVALSFRGRACDDVAIVPLHAAPGSFAALGAIERYVISTSDPAHFSGLLDAHRRSWAGMSPHDRAELWTNDRAKAAALIARDHNL